MKPETTEERLLDRAMEHVSREAREMMLDALYCRLHNRGHDLEGNTEKSDLEWFAQRLFNCLCTDQTHWEQLPEVGGRQSWMKMARVALELLPLLMSRIANRCIVQSQAIRQLLDAERRADKGETP